MPTFWILLVIFLATLVQCTIGFGNALFAMPILAFFVPLSFATPLVAMSSMMVTLVIVLADWRHVEFGDTARLVAGSVFGIPLGLWILLHADERIVKGVLALVIGLFSVYCLWQPRRFHLASDRWGYAFGWVAGILGGAYNTGGPPLVIFGFLRDWPAKQFRATLQGYFLLAGGLVLVGHAANGLWTDDVLKHFVLCLPLVALAFVLGSLLSRRLSQERFQRTTHFALLALAVMLLANVLWTQPTSSNG